MNSQGSQITIINKPAQEASEPTLIERVTHFYTIDASCALTSCLKGIFLFKLNANKPNKVAIRK